MTVATALGAKIPTEEQSEEKPKLKDWFEAEWFDGLVKIPLMIENSAVWYARLSVGEVGAENNGGICTIDNNSPVTMIFNGEFGGDDWYSLDDSICDTSTEVQVYEDGSQYRGYDCRDRVCVGSYQVDDDPDDPHTQVCNDY